MEFLFGMLWGYFGEAVEIWLLHLLLAICFLVSAGSCENPQTRKSRRKRDGGILNDSSIAFFCTLTVIMSFLLSREKTISLIHSPSMKMENLFIYTAGTRLKRNVCLDSIV